MQLDWKKWSVNKPVPGKPSWTFCGEILSHTFRAITLTPSHQNELKALELNTHVLGGINQETSSRRYKRADWIAHDAADQHKQNKWSTQSIPSRASQLIEPTVDELSFDQSSVTNVTSWSKVLSRPCLQWTLPVDQSCISNDTCDHQLIKSLIRSLPVDQSFISKERYQLI